MNNAHISRDLLTSEKTILGFTGLYIAPALWRSVSSGTMEFVMYVAVMGILLGPVLMLHRRVHLHPASLWGLSLWGLAHMCGGLVDVPDSWPTAGNSKVLYNWWVIPDMLKFDQLVHAYGFGLVTWISWQSLKWAFQNNGVTIRPTFGLLSLCAAAGIGFGALNEVVEFTAVLLIPETNVGGYENTGWDLIANLTGAMITAVLIAFFDRTSKANH